MQEIVIKELLDETPNGVIVWFESDIGGGKAEWYGEAPQAGNVYVVEFSFFEDFEWHENLVRVEDEYPLIGYKDDKLLIQGRIELIYDDNKTLVVRLESGSTELVMKRKAPIKVGDFVRATMGKVGIFDCKF